MRGSKIISNLNERLYRLAANALVLARPWRDGRWMGLFNSRLGERLDLWPPLYIMLDHGGRGALDSAHQL